MKDLLYLLMILGGVLFFTMTMKPKSVEPFYGQSQGDFNETEDVYLSSSAYLVSADNSMKGSGTVYKRLDKKLLTIYSEANLPLAVGGNFTNENIVYQLYGGDSFSNLELLSNMKRFPDGFYKANFFKGDSDREYYKKLKYFMIFSNDEKGLLPVLKGKF
jgi:hypothetical protein